LSRTGIIVQYRTGNTFLIFEFINLPKTRVESVVEKRTRTNLLNIITYSVRDYSEW
jgi:hypothetical protein